MQRSFRFRLFLFVAALLAAGNSHAQGNREKRPKSLRETARRSMHSRDSVFQSLSKSDTSINSLLQRVEQYNSIFDRINNSLSLGLDTATESEELPVVINRIDKIKVLANTKKSSTLRYLSVLRDNLDHLQAQLQHWQSHLDEVNNKLVQNQHDIVQFTREPLLKASPSDSTLRTTFFQQRDAMKKLWHQTDSANRRNLYRLNYLQNRVAGAYTDVLDASDEIDLKIRKFAERAAAGEFNYIWQRDWQYPPLDSAVRATVRLNQVQGRFFLRSNQDTHLVALVFLLAVLSWVLYNRLKTMNEVSNREAVIDHARFVYRAPGAGALLIVTTLVPYFYDHPPVLFLEFAQLFSALLVLLLVRKFFPLSLFRFLLQLFVLTVFYALSNLLIQITDADRYAIAALSVAAIFITVQFYRRTQREPQGHFRYTHFSLQIFIFLEFISLLLDITGRYSFSKIVGVTAVFNLWLTLSLYFIIRILIQVIYVQLHSARAQSSFISQINYHTMQKKMRNLLTTFSAFLWTYVLLQNLNLDDWLHDFLTDFLGQQRTVGGSTFTFGGFVIFFVVIWLSSITSRLVSYFYDISSQHANEISVLKKKNRASTLLIRIGVFSAGFLLAVAASGFPLDKLTIIFSAFGVGIGFGLQNVTNNLVSGMILAFEKPIQIGDVIEVNGRRGTIREIGIRSSKLITTDGAEIIIPNGDLISQNVVNWTLSNSSRQVDLIVSAADGTEIDKAAEVLKNVLAGRHDIMADPAPSVFVNSVSDKSVDFRVTFWAAELADSAKLRSRVLVDIYERFKKEGIALPKS